MTRIEMIRALGDAIEIVDTFASRFPTGTPEREECDALRDRLDRDQRLLTRRVLDEGTQAFRAGAQRMEELGDELRAAIEDVSGEAKALETLANLAEIAQQIARLA